MVALKVSERDCGGRLDKYLLKFLKQASTGFLYKMLRKKNIVLNGKKASGNEILEIDDEIKLFLSDETIVKFGGVVTNSHPLEREYVAVLEDFKENNEQTSNEWMNFQWDKEVPKVIYEDKDVLVLNKPIDVLSQISKKEDKSLNEWIIHYLLKKGEIDATYLLTTKPAVVNRLDRNTSGIILAGKTLKGLRFLSSLIKERTLKKFYLTIVEGNFPDALREKAFLVKKESHNTVKISRENLPGSSLIETSFQKIAQGSHHSLLKVELITGKSHQIRAHLSFLGFSIIGDGKYGRKTNHKLYKRMGLRNQFLHSYEIVFPIIDGEFSYLSERSFRAKLNQTYLKILKEMEINDAFLEIERS